MTNRRAQKRAKQAADNSSHGLKQFLREWVLPPGYGVAFRRISARFLNRTSSQASRGIETQERISSVNTLRFGYGPEFVVDIQNIRNKVGFGYTVEQHQYRRYLAQSHEDRLQCLRNFYEVFQPKSLAELLFLPTNSPGSESVESSVTRPTWFENPKSGPWELNEMSPFIGFPWEPSPTVDTSGRTEGTQYFGPYPDEKIRREAFRLENLLRSIERFGYQPHLFDGPFNVQMLTRHFQGERQAVFLPSVGSHRMAVLAHLGASRVKVRFHPRRPREYRLEDVKDFPGVEDGRFTVEQAEMIFHALFRDANQGLLTDW